MRLPSFAEPDELVAEDTRRFARMTPAERLALFLELCDLTDSIQAGRPDREALRAEQPLSQETVLLLRKLMGRSANER